jgi:hypothetical protein
MTQIWRHKRTRVAKTKEDETDETFYTYIEKVHDLIPISTLKYAMTTSFEDPAYSLFIITISYDGMNAIWSKKRS